MADRAAIFVERKQTFCGRSSPSTPDSPGRARHTHPRRVAKIVPLRPLRMVDRPAPA
jgi:hypothetical protein